MVFSATNVTKSIILELYKQVGVDVSMLYGNIEVLGDEPVGTMFILVTGTPEQQAKVTELLKSFNVEVSQVDGGILA